MFLGADVPDGLLYGVVPVLATAWLAYSGWVVILLWRISIKSENHEGRIENLEEAGGHRIRRSAGEPLG